MNEQSCTYFQPTPYSFIYLTWYKSISPRLTRLKKNQHVKDCESMVWVDAHIRSRQVATWRKEKWANPFLNLQCPKQNGPKLSLYPAWPTQFKPKVAIAGNGPQIIAPNLLNIIGTNDRESQSISDNNLTSVIMGANG